MKLLTFLQAALCFAYCVYPCSSSSPKQLLKLTSFNEAKATEIFGNSFQYKIISTGGKFTEGPVWIPDSHHGKCSTGEIPGALLFSDIPANKIMKWQNNEVSTFLDNSGCDLSKDKECKNYIFVGSNGLAIDPLTKKLTFTRHGAREVAQYDPCKPNEFTSLVGMYDNKRLNSPNDLIFTKSGDFYFTDPTYGILTQADFDRGNLFNLTARELDFAGVYVFNRKTSKVTVLDKTFGLPNGVVLSTDEKILYASNSEPNNSYIKKYHVMDDGSVSSGSIFYNFSANANSRNAMSDGFKADSEGNLYVANSAAGLHVLSSNAELIANIETHKSVSNVAIGGGHLFLTMGTDVAAVPIKKKWATANYQAEITCKSS